MNLLPEEHDGAFSAAPNPSPVRERPWLRHSLLVLYACGIAGLAAWIPLSVVFLLVFGPGALLYGLVVYLYTIPFLIVRLYQSQQQRLHREVAARVQDRHGIEVQRRPFVTLHATHGKKFRDHGIGSVMGDGENLRFYGDRLTFTLPKKRIRKVTPIPFHRAGWPGLEVEWRRDGHVYAVDLRARGYASPWRAHRVIQSVRLALRFGQPNLPPPKPGLPPGDPSSPPAKGAR